MPIFTCTSCGRLLFRPDEFLGHAWQCPTCGPTFVSEEAVDVAPQLAVLLEKEYYRAVFDESALTSTLESPKSLPDAPDVPTTDRASLLHQIETGAPPIGLKGMASAAVVAVVLVALLAASGALTSMPLADYYLQLIFFVTVGGLALAITGTSIVAVTSAIKRRRVLRAIDSRDNTRRVEGQDVEGADESIRTEPQAKGATGVKEPGE